MYEIRDTTKRAEELRYEPLYRDPELESAEFDYEDWCTSNGKRFEDPSSFEEWEETIGPQHYESGTITRLYDKLFPRTSKKFRQLRQATNWTIPDGTPIENGFDVIAEDDNTYPFFDREEYLTSLRGSVEDDEWDEEDFKAVDWLTKDLPAMRRVVREEHPDWSPEEVAIEAIKRLG